MSKVVNISDFSDAANSNASHPDISYFEAYNHVLQDQVERVSFEDVIRQSIDSLNYYGSLVNKSDCWRQMPVGYDVCLSEVEWDCFVKSFWETLESKDPKHYALLKNRIDKSGEHPDGKKYDIADISTKAVVGGMSIYKNLIGELRRNIPDMDFDFMLNHKPGVSVIIGVMCSLKEGVNGDIRSHFRNYLNKDNQNLPKADVISIFSKGPDVK